MSDLIKKFQNSRRATTVLIILVLALLNWVGYGLYLRADLSREGTLRLTDSTEQVLDSLTEEVTLEAYFSGEVPDQFVQKIKTLRDFLNEYANTSDNVKLIFHDPDTDEEARERASELGIQPAKIGALDRQKQEIASAYFAVAILYGKEKQVLPNLLETGQLEYELTSRIYQLANPDARKIGFLNSGPFSLNNSRNALTSLQILNEQVSASYGSIVNIDAEDAAIPDNVSTIIIAGPENLTDTARFQIDQFLLRGGNLIIAASGMKVNFQNFMANAAENSLIEMLDHYGIILGKDLIYDPEYYIPPTRQVGFQVLQFEYPVWVLVPEENMNQSSPVSADIPALFTPYASSLKTDGDKLKTGDDSQTRVEILAHSSGSSWLQKNFAMVDPQRMKGLDNKNKTDVGQHNIALYIQSEFKSFFADRELPGSATGNFLKKSVSPGNILIISTPYVLADFGVQRSQGVNLNFIMSAIDTMNGFEELVELRKKSAPSPRLEKISYGKQQLLTFMNFMIPLSTIAVFGFLRFLSRKRTAETVLPVKDSENDNQKGETGD